MAQPTHRTRISEQYCNDGKVGSIRAKVFCELDSDPLLSPKRLAKQLDLPYSEYRNYLTKLRSEWKYYHLNERGSKCSLFHCVRWGLWEAVKGDRGVAVERGWVLSRARNRFLVFKSVLGRAVWFESGTVRLHVRAPGLEGRAKQLFCDAFFKTGLVASVGELERLLGSLYLDSFHTVVRTPERLPYVHVRDFAGTNGFEFKSGDRTHPHCFEFIIRYQTQFERARELFEELAKSFEGLVHPNGSIPEGSSSQRSMQDYVS